MLKIAITKDANTQTFTLPVALEDSIQRAITEPGSGFQDPADWLMAALNQVSFAQVLRRYPTAPITAKAAQIETMRQENEAAFAVILTDPAIKTKSVK